MAKSSKYNSTDASDDDTYALNALKDLDGIESDNGLNIKELNISSNHQKSPKGNVAEVKDKPVIVSQKSFLKTRTIENNPNENTKTNNSTYSDVSTPPMDSVRKSVLESPVRTATLKTNRGVEMDVSYSPDFTEVTEQSKDEMTPWEKWFVMKQKEIRSRAEIERKKKLLEEQKLNQLMKKKAEEQEIRQKLWLQRKKLEESERKDKNKELEADDKKGSSASEHGFQKWYLRKLQEKKSQLQYSQELKKYEELQKEMRRKKNEKAQMEWMDKVKKRPMTPRITYAYVGDSVIGFYDSTSHPPPTYINPIPWQP